VARALVPAGVSPGPGTLADASFGTVSQPRTRVEMSRDAAGTSAQCHILFGIAVADWATLAEVG
jgi:hypothetical protein